MPFFHTCSRWAFISLMVASGLLAGCASGPQRILSEVQSFARMGEVALPSTYQLELLPSQTQQQSFSRIEAAAEQALQRVGLTRNARPEQAPLIVQVGASASQGRAYRPAYADFYGPRFGFGLGFSNGPWGGPWGGMRWMDAPPMVFYRSVKIILRDRKTQQIVYETSAEYDEIRPYDDVIWTVLFDAALSGFPHPPQGPRQVTTTLLPPPPASGLETAPPAPTPLPARP